MKQGRRLARARRAQEQQASLAFDERFGYRVIRLFRFRVVVAPSRFDGCGVVLDAEVDESRLMYGGGEPGVKVSPGVFQVTAPDLGGAQRRLIDGSRGGRGKHGWSRGRG